MTSTPPSTPLGDDIDSNDDPEPADPRAKTGRNLRKPVLVGVAALVVALVAGGGIVAAAHKTVSADRRRAAAGGGHARRFRRGRARFRRADHQRARHRCARDRHRHLRRLADRRRARPAADPDHRRPDPRGLDHRDHRRRGAGRAGPEPGGLQAVGRPVPRDPGGRPRRLRRHPLQRKRFRSAARPPPRCRPPPRPSATCSTEQGVVLGPKTPSIPRVDHPADQRPGHHGHPHRDHLGDRRGRGPAAGRPAGRGRLAGRRYQQRDPAGLRRARTRSPTRSITTNGQQTAKNEAAARRSPPAQPTIITVGTKKAAGRPLQQLQQLASSSSSSSFVRQLGSSSGPARRRSPPVPAGINWDGIANCESTNNWSINTGNGYYGGLQFDICDLEQRWRSAYALASGPREP